MWSLIQGHASKVLSRTRKISAVTENLQKVLMSAWLPTACTTMTMTLSPERPCPTSSFGWAGRSTLCPICFKSYRAMLAGIKEDHISLYQWPRDLSLKLFPFKNTCDTGQGQINTINSTKEGFGIINLQPFFIIWNKLNYHLYLQSQRDGFYTQC